MSSGRMCLLSRSAFLVTTFSAAVCWAQAKPIDNGSTYWGAWPEHADPVVAGKKVAENLALRPLPWERAQGIDYRDICTGYGSIRLAAWVQDKELMDKLVKRYSPILTPQGQSLITRPNHVDMTVFGIVPLEIFKHNASLEEKKIALEAIARLRPVTPMPAGGTGGAGRGRGARGGARGGAMTPGGQNLTPVIPPAAPPVPNAPSVQADNADPLYWAAMPGGPGLGGPDPVTGAGRAGRGGRGAGGGARNNGELQRSAEAAFIQMNLSHQEQMTRWLTIGWTHAQTQWASPWQNRVNDWENGLTDQTRMWVDDMVMITAIQCQAYRVTGNKVFLDRAAREAVVYLDRLQQPNGLFHHADDSPFFWGRGNGWFAVGMAELLSDLPEDHPQRGRILEGYRKMMASLLSLQAPSGMWRQLVDNGQSWEESSGTGMFTFAMATGVRNGWLPEAQYKDAARKGWIALSSHIDAQGNVTDTCVGTNKGYSIQYYMDRDRVTGDLHGQAGYVWAAWAMMQPPLGK